MSHPNRSNTKLALVAAILVGLFALVAINKYIKAKTTLPPAPTVCILVATEEIAKDATFDGETLGVAEIPASALSNIHVALPAQTAPGFAAALAEAKAKFTGRASTRLISANTPVFWIDMTEAPKTELTDLIGEGMRAVTLPVDTVSSVCNFIRPGSRVDIIITAAESRLGLLGQTVDGGEDQPDRVVTTALLQNVPVLAVDRNFQMDANVDGYGTMTLHVPTRAALMLIQARTMGTLTYLLRSERDTATQTDTQQNTIYPGAPFRETVRSFEQQP